MLQGFLIGVIVALSIWVVELSRRLHHLKEGTRPPKHVHEWGPFGLPYNVHHPKAYDEIDFEYRPPWDETRQEHTCTTCGLNESVRIR